MNHNIYVFSGPVRSGKTTRLRQWVAGRQNVAGILSPDINGLRTIFDIRSGNHHTFEVNDTYQGDTIKIGRFVFAKTGFEEGRQIIRDAVVMQPSWLVIDEVGKLETEQGEGLEPAVQQAIAAWQQGMPGKLLLVIRDTLLQQALRKYELYGCHILEQNLPA